MMNNLPILKQQPGVTLPKGTSLYMAVSSKDPEGRPTFRMTKFDHLGDLQETYTIRRVGEDLSKAVCSCPAYIDNCRHKRMLRHLIRFGGLNTDKVIGMCGKSMSWYELLEPLIDPDILNV